MTARKLMLPVLLVLLSGALLYNLYLQSQPSKARRSGADLPKYTLDQVDWTRFDDSGRPDLRGRALKLDYYDDAHATGQQLKLTALRRHGKPWIATAPSGLMPAGSQRIRLDGDVQAHGYWPDDGRPLTIDTTRLWVNPTLHELTTAAKVTLHSTDRQGTATGLRADWVAQNVSLYSDVRMQYDVAKP